MSSLLIRHAARRRGRDVAGRAADPILGAALTLLGMPHGDVAITQLLRDAQGGGDGAADRLAQAVYAELRRTAAAYLRRERADHMLQPTALVHDVFLRLVDQRRVEWRSRTQFFAVAAQMMRRMLVDHARRARAAKRGGRLVTLDDALPDAAARSVDVIRVDDALEALAAIDARQARIVELRFFAGLTIDETADALGVSPITVSREWAVARAWLHAELTRD